MHLFYLVEYQYNLAKKEIESLKKQMTKCESLNPQFPPITIKPNDYEPNIFKAVEGNKLDSIRWLIEQENVNVNITNANEETPLNITSQYGHLKIVQYLCQKGADPNIPSNKATNGYYPTLWASVYGHNDIIKYLVEEAHADIHAKRADGFNLLHNACHFENLSLLKYLCENGCNKETKSLSGLTPLYYACSDGYYEIVKYLCENGANKNVTNKKGKTLIHCVLSRNKFQKLKYLVEEQKMDINVPDRLHKTPIICGHNKGFGVVEKNIYMNDTCLNENDFILTLISVHDESVRRKIEKFCSDALVPVISGTSYNQLFNPKASHIIRAVMAYGFKRARLRYAYMILEGKDLSTGIYDSSRREKMFDQLRTKLDIVLNLSNWHDFMKCLITAGYVSSNLIAADNAIVYTYVMYLIGLIDFKLDRLELRKLIALWFYMSTVTMRYSISTESTVQSDLNDIEKLASSDDFRNYIMQRIEETFTDDFFAIQLPANMETSASISPSWNAYCAAQNILGTDAMFSSVPLKILFSPGSSGNKSSVDKHHLFPRAYLPTIGHTTRQEINQIANFAYIEWPQNIAISDEAPSAYWPQITSSMSPDAIRKICDENALPEGWESMDYPEFLNARRHLMAEIVKRGYMALLTL